MVWRIMAAIGLCRRRATIISLKQRLRPAADFLFDELKERISKGPVSFRVLVQVAGSEVPWTTQLSIGLRTGPGRFREDCA